MSILRDSDWGVDGWAHVVEIISALQVGSGDPVGGARLHGAVRAFEQRIGMRLEPMDEPPIARLLDEARLVLGAEAFDAAVVEGRSWEPELMFAKARDWLDPR